MSKRYRLIIFDKAQAGHDIETVKTNLAKQLKIPLSKLNALLEKPFVLKNGLTKEQAIKYKQFADKLGIVYKITEEVPHTSQQQDTKLESPQSQDASHTEQSDIPPSTQMICPKCGAMQEKSPKCIKCGIFLKNIT